MSAVRGHIPVLARAVRVSHLLGGIGSVPIAVEAQHAAVAPALVFAHVTVVDVERGRLVPNQRVVIRGNHIQAVGEASIVAIPPIATVVNATGKYLMPGLWDMHVHPDRHTDAVYPMLLANGVTGIRDPGSSVPLDTLIRKRREILAGTRLGPPRQVLSGQSIAGPEPDCQRSIPYPAAQTCIAGSADARHYVDSLAAAGADMIKPRDVSREMYFVIAAEARRIGIPFGGHAQEETAIEASDSGARTIDHMQYKMEGDGLAGLCWRQTREPLANVDTCQPVAERLRRNGTWVVPTLFVYHGGGPRAGGGGERAGIIADRLEDAIKTFWADSVHGHNWLRAATDSGGSADSLGSMAAMQRVGLPILAGTDHNPQSDDIWGFSLHVELAMYVAEGLTPLHALQSATWDPAKMLHATDSLGTVAPGKLADLVLLNADPLADITNTTAISAVVANGRYYDRAALDEVLAAARAAIAHAPLLPRP